VKGRPIAHFSFMYLYPLPDDSRMNDRNVAKRDITEKDTMFDISLRSEVYCMNVS